MSELHEKYGECLGLNKPGDPQCLPVDDPAYRPPTPEEIRDALRHGEYWTGAVAAVHLGVSGRTIRKWTGGEQEMPYAAWRLLLILKRIVGVFD